MACPRLPRVRRTSRFMRGAWPTTGFSAVAGRLLMWRVSAWPMRQSAAVYARVILRPDRPHLRTWLLGARALSSKGGTSILLNGAVVLRRLPFLPCLSLAARSVAVTGPALMTPAHTRQPRAAPSCWLPGRYLTIKYVILEAGREPTEVGNCMKAAVARQKSRTRPTELCGAEEVASSVQRKICTLRAEGQGTCPAMEHQ